MVFWLEAKGAERDLGGIEQLAAFNGVDGPDDHALSGAGDEVADVLVAGEVGHGVAVGFDGVFLGVVVVETLLSTGFERALVGLAAALDGSVAGGRQRRGLEGAGMDAVSVMLFAPESIVRGVGVIICKCGQIKYRGIFYSDMIRSCCQIRVFRGLLTGRWCANLDFYAVPCAGWECVRA